MTDLTSRIDETSTLVQQAIITPAREGLAIIAAVKATSDMLQVPTGGVAPADPKKKIPCSLVDAGRRRW